MQYALLLHGGAGRWHLTSEQKEKYKHFGLDLLQTAERWLREGAMSLDVVEKVVLALEDSGLFNAGKGAVRNALGEVETDAALMCGRTRRVGAVASVSLVKNPIGLARLVMDFTPHVMLAGTGATRLAQDKKVRLAEDSYFQAASQQTQAPSTRGTVGAVALDIHGDLAVATSTGGHTEKMPGRVGDSPLIGAGTFADNQSCAVSATGNGEFFIRHVAAHEIASRIRWGGQPLKTATQSVIDEVATSGGLGGVIVLNKRGEWACPYSTEGMYHAGVFADGHKFVEF